jgi:small-conductance mechanosensitive channel
MHFHFNQKNPSIEYFNCSNYVGNRGTCPDTHYIRVDFLTPTVLSELNQLILFARHQWEAFSAAVEQTATVAAKDQTSSLTKKHQEFQNRMRELKTLLARLYEDKVKGVVDDETFVLLSSEFKKERGQIQKQMQRIQESLQKSNSILYGIALFKEAVDKQKPIISLNREHLGKYVDHITVYPAKQEGRERVQKFEIHYRFIGCVDLGEHM